MLSLYQASNLSPNFISPMERYFFSPKFSCLQTHQKLSLFWILEKPEGWPGKIFADNFNFSLVYSTYFAVPMKMCPCLLSQKSDIKIKPIMKQLRKKNKDFERYLEK
jgi:hypothetical protein